MCHLRGFVITCLVISVSAKTIPKDAIGFPEVEENQSIKNKENRQPVYLPSMCPVNELYYPGDQKDDWICDCRPAFIYHPATDQCWPAFQKGPCQEAEYLSLPQNSVLPVCEKNPCVIDTYVTWNGKCEQLGSTTPCANLFPAAAALGVNATTLAVSCVKLNIENRFRDPTPEEPPVLCPRGRKKSVNGQCVPVSF